MAMSWPILAMKFIKNNTTTTTRPREFTVQSSQFQSWRPEKKNKYIERGGPGLSDGGLLNFRPLATAVGSDRLKASQILNLGLSFFFFLIFIACPSIPLARKSERETAWILLKLFEGFSKASRGQEMRSWFLENRLESGTRG